MAIATDFAGLQALSRDELVALYDATLTRPIHLGLGFIREEIARRDAAETNRKMLALTRQMWIYTLIVTVATVVNVLLFIFSMLR